MLSMRLPSRVHLLDKPPRLAAVSGVAALPGRGMLRLRWQAEPVATDRAAALLARQQADRAANVERGCASVSSAGPAGWRPTPTSAPPTAKSSAS
jgi:hypothetical protein